MKKIMALALCGVLAAAAFALAKDYTKDLKSKDEEKRLEAASALKDKAMSEGLTSEELDALIAAAEDESEVVRVKIASAIANNSKIAVAQEYAQMYGTHQEPFIGFLLWYSVYTTYGRVNDIMGGDTPGKLPEEMKDARTNALEAYKNILDPDRKERARPYYEELKP